MKLTFYGGASEVGRAAILLEEDGNPNKNLLFDCGIKLGENTEYPLINDDDLKRIRNVTVSHAHLDHSGYLPHLYARGVKPNIFMTKPTRDLVGVLLADYQRIHKMESRQKRLFTTADVNNVLKDTKMCEYNEPFNADFNVSFSSAGHIMGSAITKIAENNGIIFSGDICMRKTRILDPADRNLSGETLIMESTYGSKDDLLPSFKDSYQKMIAIINQTLDAGGHVVIPSFAVGRAQEVLMALDDYMRSGALRSTKIYIDGMIDKAMKIYRHNAIYANDDIKKRILMSEDDPFKSINFHRPRSKDKSDVISEPCIIVTTSGMLSGGPILSYLRALGNNPKNTLIFVGYQARGTRGSKIMSGERTINLADDDEEKDEVEIKMRVESVRLSGHADFNELIQFAKSIKGLKRIFLMHGEKSDLKDAFEKDYEVVLPKLMETYNI